MTEDERTELRRLHEAATAGPWVHTTDAMTGSEWGYIRPGVCAAPLATMWRNHERLMPNAEFIAAARTAVPALLDENERLRAVLALFASGFPSGDVEPATHYYQGEWQCNYCGARNSDIRAFQHVADCPVTRARALLEGTR
jgi:hypothetical protein